MRKGIEIITLPYLLLMSCSSTKLVEDRKLLKEYAFCKCFEYASKDTSFFKSDLSKAIYMDIAHYDLDAYESIDSLAKQAVSEIKPFELADYKGKQAIFLNCFKFYKSRRLDSAVKSLDKRKSRDW